MRGRASCARARSSGVGAGTPAPPGDVGRRPPPPAAPRARRGRDGGVTPASRPDIHARRARRGVRERGRLEPGSAHARLGLRGSRSRGDSRGRGLPPLLPRRGRLRSLTDTQGPAWMHSGARPRRRRNRVLWLIVGIVTAAVAFALGVALGQALEENPDPERAPSTTLVRTLTVPLEPTQTTGG